VGVEVRYSSDTSIQTSSIVGNFAGGIGVQGSTGTLIANNTLSNTRASNEVLVFSSNGTLIEGNRMRGGIATSVQSVLGSNNDVIGNVFLAGRTTDIGVSMDSAEGRIANNEISGFDFAAVLVGADGIRVEKNSIHDSGRGIQLQGSFFGRPTGVVVRRNEVFNTHVAILIREMTDTLVKRNATHDNRIGISVRDSTGTAILKNRSDHNADDGIQVHDPATTVTHNRADLNGDLGIQAVEGVTDGGGNKARGNGNPAQCLNVDC
jgi:parallel beta-helix repeat protein